MDRPQVSPALPMLLGLVISCTVHAQAMFYPRIQQLTPSDLVFRQIQDSIAQGYRAESRGKGYPDLFIGEWLARGDEDLFSLAARFSLPYEALATLNGLANPTQFTKGQRILVPSMAGLFVAAVPRNDLDILMAARLDTGLDEPIKILLDGQTLVTFYPAARLNGTERSFFLNIGFRMPLPQGVLTSSYGMRRSPIDGNHRMHEGIDLAAPVGTDVLAARNGTVLETGFHQVLGKYIILSHDGGWRTVYGHLLSIDIVLNQVVASGTIIAKVGSTGMSTGPHLHFEIRLGGTSKDPSSYLRGLSQ